MVPWGDNCVNLSVTVNQRLIEAHKLGCLEATDILDKFYKALSEELEKYVPLGKVSISHIPFVKSFDGKIKIKFYRSD